MAETSVKIQAASEFPSVTHPKAAFLWLSKRYTQGTPVGGVVLEVQAYLSVADTSVQCWLSYCSLAKAQCPHLQNMDTKKCRLLQGHGEN